MRDFVEHPAKSFDVAQLIAFPFEYFFSKSWQVRIGHLRIEVMLIVAICVVREKYEALERVGRKAMRTFATGVLQAHVLEPSSDAKDCPESGDNRPTPQCEYPESIYVESNGEESCVEKNWTCV